MTAVPLVAKTGIGFGDETLSVYDEGTWNPVPAFTTNGSTTYVVNGNTYTRIGNMVTVRAYITITSIAGASGDLLITGLPFPTASGTNAYQMLGVFFGLLWADGTNPAAYISQGTSTIVLNVQSSTQVTAAMCATNADIIIQGTYFI